MSPVKTNTSGKLAGSFWENQYAFRIDRTEYWNDFQRIGSDFDTANEWSVHQVGTSGTAGIQVTGNGGYDWGNLRLDAPTSGEGPIVQLDSKAAYQKAPVGALVYTEQPGDWIESHFVFLAKHRTLGLDRSSLFLGVAELNSTSALWSSPAGPLTSNNFAGFVWYSSDADTVAQKSPTYFTARGSGGPIYQSPNLYDLTAFEHLHVAVEVFGPREISFYIRQQGPDADWFRAGTVTLETPIGFGSDPGNFPDNTQMLPTTSLLSASGGEFAQIDYMGLTTLRNWERNLG